MFEIGSNLSGKLNYLPDHHKFNIIDKLKKSTRQNEVIF